MIRSGSEDLPKLHWASFLHETFVHCFEIEGSIVFIQEVACPETNHCITDFQIRSPVERAIEGLADVVLFSPVDTSGSIIVRLEHNPVEDRTWAAGDRIFSTDI